MKPKTFATLLITAILLFGFVSPVSANPVLPSHLGPDNPDYPGSLEAVETARIFINSIKSTTNSIRDISMVMVDDHPWVAYYDETEKDLEVAHYLGGSSSTGNCGPNDSWQCDTVDSTGDVGQFSSIAHTPGSGLIFGSKIGITYYDATGPGNTYLKYTYHSCWLDLTVGIQCGWSAPIVLGYNANRSSLKYDPDGNEYVAMYYPVFNAVYIISPLYTSGTPCASLDFPWKCILVENMDGEDDDSYVSLDLNKDGHPYLAYYDPVNHLLRYAWEYPGGSCGGGSWSCKTIESGEDIGKGIQLHVAKSNPPSPSDKTTMAYYNATTGMLRLAQFVESGGDCGWGNNLQCFDIDEMGTGIADPNISMAASSDGVPYIGYVAWIGGFPGAISLRVAKPAFLGNCGPSWSIPPYLTFHTWQCSEIDSAGFLGGIVDPAIGVYSTGKYGLAYSSWFTLIGTPSMTTYSLDFASQREVTYIPLIAR